MTDNRERHPTPSRYDIPGADSDETTAPFRARAARAEGSSRKGVITGLVPHASQDDAQDVGGPELRVRIQENQCGDAGSTYMRARKWYRNWDK